QAGQINRTNSTASSQQGSSDNENSDKDDDDDDQQQGAGVNNVAGILQKSWKNLKDTQSGETITGDSPSCNACFIRIAGKLLLKYRLGIDKNDLPNQFKSKPNCYWGHNCRTQSHNVGHAQRFNHLCRQTRKS
ncbi:MAG: hypothetical protein EZS28_054058, partial [Streblomastix strix]